MLLVYFSSIRFISCSKTIIFVLADYRTGSSVTGSFMSRVNNSLYLFEPLRTFGMSKIRHESRKPAQLMLERMINCQFQGLARDFNFTDYVFVFNQHEPDKRIKLHNKMKSVNYTKFIEEAEEETSRRCNKASTIVVKTVRLFLKDLVPLLQDISSNESFNYHVILMVRDPRAVYNSRIRLHWCINMAWCIKEDEFCSSVRDNYQTYLSLPLKMQKRIHPLRFEDLAEEPVKTAEKLYKKLSLPFTGEVEKFIETHTSKNRRKYSGPYSTYRNSSRVIEKWKRELPSKFRNQVENNCQDILALFNYE